MPTYQYACTDCGERLEVVQSFTDDALTVCPSCDGRLRKVFSAVGVVFKGSGFYRTDSRSPGKTGSATVPAAATSTTSSNGSSDGTTPSTPAATPAVAKSGSAGSSGSGSSGSASTSSASTPSGGSSAA